MKTTGLKWAVILMVAAAAAGCSKPGKWVSLRLGEKTIRAELADTAVKREKGLQGRNSLGENEGMLFVFPEPRNLSFWSKDTTLPLSLAFIDDAGVIQEIVPLPPETQTPVTSRAPCRYALEMREGWFERNGVAPGDALRMDWR